MFGKKFFERKSTKEKTKQVDEYTDTLIKVRQEELSEICNKVRANEYTREEAQNWYLQNIKEIVLKTITGQTVPHFIRNTPEINDEEELNKRPLPKDLAQLTRDLEQLIEERPDENVKNRNQAITDYMSRLLQEGNDILDKARTLETDSSQQLETMLASNAELTESALQNIVYMRTLAEIGDIDAFVDGVNRILQLPQYSNRILELIARPHENWAPPAAKFFQNLNGDIHKESKFIGKLFSVFKYDQQAYLFGIDVQNSLSDPETKQRWALYIDAYAGEFMPCGFYRDINVNTCRRISYEDGNLNFFNKAGSYSSWTLDDNTQGAAILSSLAKRPGIVTLNDNVLLNSANCFRVRYRDNELIFFDENNSFKKWSMDEESAKKVLDKFTEFPTYYRLNEHDVFNCAQVKRIKFADDALSIYAQHGSPVHYEAETEQAQSVLLNFIGRPAFINMRDGGRNVINALCYRRIEFENGNITFVDNSGTPTSWTSNDEEGHRIVSQVSRLPTYFKIDPENAVNLLSYVRAEHRDGRIVFHDTSDTKISIAFNEQDARDTMKRLSDYPYMYAYNDCNVLNTRNLCQIQKYSGYMEFKNIAGNTSYGHPGDREADTVLSDTAKYPNYFTLNPRNALNTAGINRILLMNDEFVVFDNRNNSSTWSAAISMHEEWFKQHRRTGQQLYVSPFSKTDPYGLNDAFCLYGLGSLKHKYNAAVCTHSFLTAAALVCGNGVDKAFDGPAKQPYSPRTTGNSAYRL